MTLPHNSRLSVPWLASAGVLALVAGLAVLTNPTPADYQERAATEINGFLLTQVCPHLLQQSTTMSLLVMEACEELEMGSASEIERYIAYHTRYYNLGVATLFVTELPMQAVWSLGVFGHILPLPLS